MDPVQRCKVLLFKIPQVQVLQSQASQLVAAGFGNIGAPATFDSSSFRWLKDALHAARSTRDIRLHAVWRVELVQIPKQNRDQPLSDEANSYWRQNINVCVSVIRCRIRRAAGNGLGRGRPTRERGQ